MLTPKRCREAFGRDLVCLQQCSNLTGAISSLQRQLEIQESQLQRTKSEKEMLQKKLRERENQLQALSTKVPPREHGGHGGQKSWQRGMQALCNNSLSHGQEFCSLTEGKHEETMATTEKENCSLRQEDGAKPAHFLPHNNGLIYVSPQVVTEQESKLAEQNKLISELQGTVSQLQAEVLASRYHIHKQQRAQEAIQSQVETLQHRELQTRVALECITSRFERYRSKIIQATFSTAGSKPPQAEVTDEEVLEAMQKIINERMEFHQMLKQKGIKVPSLCSIDMSTSSPTSAKGRRKSPAR
ncbi:coiled-coil domain-containing protein 27 [Morus bassanus]